MKRSNLSHHWLTVLAALMCAPPLAVIAAPPSGGGGGKVTVTAAVPADAYQGEELTVTVSGSGFDAGSTARYLITGTTDASQVDVLSVQYISSSELRTYIRPKPNALPTDYDIEVQTSSGRKGKGTTLFRVKLKGQQPPPPPPTEPAARYWHSFTGNNSSTPEASRLYLFGGDGGPETDWQSVPPDLWSYSVSDAKWTVHAWLASTQPSKRKHAGLSCGAGLCVLANGGNIGPLKDTWIYTEESDSWSELNCRRYLCPSARWMPTSAYDSARNHHLLFGGLKDWTNLNDTYTFSNATQRWTLHKPSASPTGRRSAAAAFVAGPVNRIVLHGGQVEFTEILCDMWSWTGANWEKIEQINGYDGPCLHSHSIAWDGARLVVTGGYVDYNDTPNEGVWTFEFTPDGKAGTWTYRTDWYFYFQCSGAGVLRPGAFMAYDRPSGNFAFFGGVENLPGMGAVAYDDFSVCN